MEGGGAGGVFKKEVLVTFIVLLCCVVSSSSLSVVFSVGTLLQVDEDVNPPHPHTHTGPSVRFLSSVRLSQDPGSPRLLVCLLTGLALPHQAVLWWLDNTPVGSGGVQGPWVESEAGYTATAVWEVSAADWRSATSIWCGTVQEGREYRERLCMAD